MQWQNINSIRLDFFLSFFCVCKERRTKFKKRTQISFLFFLRWQKTKPIWTKQTKLTKVKYLFYFLFSSRLRIDEFCLFLILWFIIFAYIFFSCLFFKILKKNLRNLIENNLMSAIGRSADDIINSQIRRSDKFNVKTKHINSNRIQSAIWTERNKI